MSAVIVTIPGMIEAEDYKDLTERMEVDYVERESISEEDLAQLASRYEYLLLNYDVVKTLTSRFYNAVRGGRLKAISVEITGMDWANPTLANDVGISLMYLPDYCTDSIAEQTIAEALYHARRMQEETEDLTKGERPSQRLSRNLRARVIGVIGLGYIGTRTAQIASCLGMHVVGWNRTPKPDNESVEMLASPEAVLEQSEFVTLGLKTTPETEGFLTQSRLGLLRQGAVLLNLASRKLVDNAAVADALREGRLAGYSVGRGGATEQAFAGVPRVHLVSSYAWYSEESVANLKRKWVRHVIDHLEGNEVPIAS